MPESGEPAVSWPGSVLYVAHGAKLALLWLTVGGVSGTPHWLPIRGSRVGMLGIPGPRGRCPTRELG